VGRAAAPHVDVGPSDTLGAGLRWGEAAALRVGDIDFLKRRVLLHRNAVTVNKRTAVGTLKSGKNRTIALAAFVVTELAKTCEGKELDDLIWPSRSGGYLAPPQRMTLGWPERSLAARRPTRGSHGVPRTRCGTPRRRWRSHQGANVKVVQRMLGHASAAMTLDVYADLFDDDLTAVADKLDESVGKVWARGATIDD
jgi:integrase